MTIIEICLKFMDDPVGSINSDTHACLINHFEACIYIILY